MPTATGNIPAVAYVTNLNTWIGIFYNYTVQTFIQHNNVLKDVRNSWLYCFTNPLELGTRVSLLHRQPYVMFHKEASIETIKTNTYNST